MKLLADKELLIAPTLNAHDDTSPHAGFKSFLCRIKIQSEEHATDLPFPRQIALSEVWSVAEVPPAAISCGQVFVPV